MNLILLLVLSSPVVWLFVQHRRKREVSVRAAMSVYIAFSLIYGLGSLFSYYQTRLHFANVSPYIIGYNFVQPTFAGKDMYDGPLLHTKILPVAFFLYPFLLYSPLAFVPVSRPVLRISLQATLFALHTVWSGLCLFALAMD
jgi:hypothetical protein